MRDIAPDAPYPSSNNSSGVIIGVAGDVKTTYAVSQNAGVWVWRDGRWSQLASSPRYAQDIAVEPAHVNHVIVGERNGDSVDKRLNQTGVWESMDWGATWTYSLDPLQPLGRAKGCKSQAVVAVAFSPKGHLLAATSCGLAHRDPAASSQWGYPTMPAADGVATAIASSETKVWARTLSGQLFVSTDEGVTWRAVPAAMPWPSGTLIDDHNAWTGSPSFSLAAFDDEVVMVATRTPRGQENEVALVDYDVASQTWQFGHVRDQNGHRPRDGRGLGGRVFVKAYAWDRRHFFLLSAGQALYRLDERTPNVGFMQFNATLLAACASTDTCPDNALALNRVHVDLWDAHVDTTAPYGAGYLTDDGGVEQKWASPTWTNLAAGLHTHHVQGVSIAGRSVGYACPDNDAWYGPSDGSSWRATNRLGDGGWTDADAANGTWMLLARSASGAAVMQRLDGSAASMVRLSTDASRFSLPHVIQTLVSERVPQDLDAVMLVFRPLLGVNKQPVGGALATLASGDGPAIIRNTTWSRNADVSNGYIGWNVEVASVPPGAEALWSSGGHTVIAAPLPNTPPVGLHYYITAREPDPGDASRTVLNIYRSKDLPSAGWTPLFSGAFDLGREGFDPDNGLHGPVFPNPYNNREVWILGSDGVYVSKDGATTSPDPVLTALITDSGRYEISHNNVDDRTFDGIAEMPFGGRTVSMGPLADMAFARDRANVRVAAGTVTGVFYDDGDGIWRSLTPSLPRPLAIVTGVKTDGRSVFVSFGGRSVVRVDAPGAARPVTYYEVSPLLPSDQAGILLDHARRPIAGATVSLHVLDPKASVVFDGKVTTGPHGEIVSPISGSTLIGGAFYIAFAGDRDNAPSETRFVVTRLRPRP